MLTVPTVQTRANRIGKLLGSVGGQVLLARLNPTSSTLGLIVLPCCPYHEGVLYFSRSPSGSGRRCLGLTGLHGGPSQSFLCRPGYPEYRSVSSLLKTFAVALVLKARSWRKHNHMWVLFRWSLKTFHLGLCGAGFWPWFSPWSFARIYLPFSDPCLMIDSFVFAPALHWYPLRSLVQRWVFTTYVSIFSFGRFLVNITLLFNSATWCPYCCIS